DQAFENVRELSEHYRIIAPSRFGYPGSSVAGEGTPKEQAAALIALLNILNIETVYVLGASAGGTLALRFALDYPERTAGLI
uniref:alpha/beta fold hydrolase n=1 Tax=Bradyrhizobium cosmicum TaxID=1404864 RepID=UPI0028E18E35